MAVNDEKLDKGGLVSAPEVRSSGLGLVRSLGSVKLIAQTPIFTRAGDPDGVRRGTAYVTHPGALVGRNPHADVRIDDQSVSWEHCVIQPRGIDWVLIPRSKREGVLLSAGRKGSLVLPRNFPWVLVEGLGIRLGEHWMLVEIDRPDRIGATTTIAAHAANVLPPELFETAWALTTPYRDAPPRHTFASVREMVATLEGVTTREGVYRRLGRLEEWPGIAAEIENRLHLEHAGAQSGLAGALGRYEKLAAAIVAAYPGFGEVAGERPDPQR